MPRSFSPISESALLRTLLLCASELGARLFRNTVGHFVLAQPDCKSCHHPRIIKRITTGLGTGSSDLVGWMPVVVTPDMVGTRVALFVGIEVKRESGGVVREDQRRFLTALETAGAVQGVVRSVAELETVLAPWRSQQR